MNKLKVLIVDDEFNARAALKGMIHSNFDYIEIIGEAESVPEAVKWIHGKKPDIVLLDIEMPGYLGTDLLDFFNVEDINFAIIFVTAYNDYAIRAFELSAVDYLLKPTRVEQLDRAFQRVLKQNRAEESQKLTLVKSNLEQNTWKQVAIQTAEGLLIKNLDEIVLLKADSAYTHIYFSDNTKITITKTLSEYMALENSNHFIRINRSYLINLHHIERISKKDGGFVKMTNGEEIAASIEKRQLLYERFRDRTL